MTSSMRSSFSMAFILDCTNEALLALNRNLSMKPCMWLILACWF